jgi:hypothetical protein
MAKRPPRGWKPISGGGVACPHRDLFVCADCQDNHVELVNVYEEFFWVGGEGERAELIAQLDDMGFTPTTHQRMKP